MKTIVVMSSILILSACGLLSPGTATHDVLMTNATDQPLTVYEIRRGPRLARVIAAGATIKSSWPYPLSASDSRKARLEADDRAGSRTYCNEFGWQDLTRLDWRIVITLNSDSCPR
jgi:hypothetical protein